MAWGLAANLAAVGAIMLVGFAVDRHVNSGAKLGALPTPLQLLVGGVAIAPIVYFGDRLAVGPIDGLVVSLAVSIALWIGLPAVFARVTGVGTTGGGARC